MNTQSKTPSVFMRDYADDDPRSVQASIEGRDDGRSALYLRYFNRNLDPAHSYSVSEIYQAGMRAANLPERKPRAFRIVKGVLTSVAGLLIGAVVARHF